MLLLLRCLSILLLLRGRLWSVGGSVVSLSVSVSSLSLSSFLPSFIHSFFSISICFGRRANWIWDSPKKMICYLCLFVSLFISDCVFSTVSLLMNWIVPYETVLLERIHTLTQTYTQRKRKIRPDIVSTKNTVKHDSFTFGIDIENSDRRLYQRGLD